MKAVILAGGSGTRLWPVSREDTPKQFHAFVGDLTLLQSTFERLSFLPPEDIYIATSAKHRDEIIKQLPKLVKENILLESECRDTGPAIAFAAHRIGKIHPDEVLAIVYADHLIRNPVEFRKKLLFAEYISHREHTINIIEVPAASPNPNLGYVKIGKPCHAKSDNQAEAKGRLSNTVAEGHNNQEYFELERFVEKPNEAVAHSYINEGSYLWNTGIYVSEISVLMEAFRTYAPEILSCIEELRYVDAPKISIDYAVMEKIDPKRVRIIPAQLGWSDIGNWNALFDEMADHPGGNFIQGEHIGLETQGSLIFSETPGKLIVTNGVKDLIIVDTRDALIVLPKSRAHEVKQLVEEVRRQKKSKHL